MMRTLLSATVLAVAAMVATAPAASAHTELKSSDPANGAQIATAPSQLTLTFSEPIPADGATVEVIGPDNTPWQVGTITAAGPTLTVPVQPAGPAGQYTIAWKVTSADGDPVRGTVRFTLTSPVAVTTTTTTPPPTTTSEPTTMTPPASPSPAAQAQPTDSGGIPTWVWILGPVVLVAVGVAVALGLGRSRRSTQE